MLIPTAVGYPTLSSTIPIYLGNCEIHITITREKKDTAIWMRTGIYNDINKEPRRQINTKDSESRLVARSEDRAVVNQVIC